jgi:hypothetical protein
LSPFREQAVPLEDGQNLYEIREDPVDDPITAEKDLSHVFSIELRNLAA